MVQESRPQAGRSTTYPNAGPYSADKWAQLLHDFISGVDFPDKGVFYSSSNQLEPTNPAGTQTAVNTGRAIINGRYFRNTASVNLIATTPAAAARYDRVVAILNNTNAAISTQSPSGYTFITSGAGTSIPAYSIELALMLGAEGGGVPALEQDASRLWMIPLAQYQISTAPATISNYTDQREFVDAETKTVFVPATFGYDFTGGAPIAQTGTIAVATTFDGIVLPTAVSAYGGGYWKADTDFIGSMILKPVITQKNVGVGNAYCRTWSVYGSCAQSPATHSDATAFAASALSGGVYDCGLFNLTVTNESAGDIFQFQFERDGTNVLDTLGVDIQLHGFNVEYLGWKR